jgi:lipoprotein LprG
VYARRATARVVPLLVAVALVAGLGACSKPNRSSLPPASQLLQQSGQAMGDVTSAHVDLKFGGFLSSLISAAQGDVSRDGKAVGSFSLGGTEFPFRLLKGTFYLKPPTGGWVSSPPPYDPTALLDPTNGLPSILTKATAGTTQASESVGGVDAYRVTASIPTELIKSLTDLASGQDTLKATVWIAASGSRLLKFVIPYRAKDATEDTTLTGNLTNFGIAVNVTPPV